MYARKQSVLCVLICMNPVFCFMGSYLAMFILCIGWVGPYLSLKFKMHHFHGQSWKRHIISLKFTWKLNLDVFLKYIINIYIYFIKNKNLIVSWYYDTIGYCWQENDTTLSGYWKPWVQVQDNSEFRVRHSGQISGGFVSVQLLQYCNGTATRRD
jgi:hypothetical protein